MIKSKKIKIALLIICSFVALVIIFNFVQKFAANSEEKHLINEGNKIIVKVEDFKKLNNRLPVSLTEIGMTDSEKGPLYYSIGNDSTYYHVWFAWGSSFFGSEVYDSKTQNWKVTN